MTVVEGIIGKENPASLLDLGEMVLLTRMWQKDIEAGFKGKFTSVWDLIILNGMLKVKYKI